MENNKERQLIQTGRVIGQVANALFANSDVDVQDVVDFFNVGQKSQKSEGAPSTKIRTIKLVRGFTGMSLKEAKDLVEENDLSLPVSNEGFRIVEALFSTLLARVEVVQVATDKAGEEGRSLGLEDAWEILDKLEGDKATGLLPTLEDAKAAVQTEIASGGCTRG